MEFTDATSRFVDLDGMRVHVRRTGAGPTLVLLHGSGASLHVFDAVTDLLADRFDVVRADLPGFGLTGPRPDRDYSTGAYVSFLDRLLEPLAQKRFVLAGHSFGGQVAWTYALAHPDRLRGLVLMNATGYPDKDVPLAIRLARIPPLRPVLRRVGSRTATARNHARLVGPGSDVVDDAMVDRVHALMSRPGAREAFVDFANTDQPDRSAEIAAIRTPTLVLSSERVSGQHFGRDIPDSYEVVLPGVGHLMPAEAPAEVSRAITAFAAGLDREDG
jgi:pimeloyl-ACP methyl ester carboxylesterase